MRYLFGVLCVLALGMVPPVGCGPDNGGGGNGGSAGSGGSGGLVGSGGTGGSGGIGGMGGGGVGGDGGSAGSGGMAGSGGSGGSAGVGGVGGTAGDGGSGGLGGEGGSGGLGGEGGNGGAGGACPADPEAAIVPMVCRVSGATFWGQAVWEFTANLEVALADCTRSTFNANVTPTLTFSREFLNSAAETLCDLGGALTEFDITAAQVQADAVMGAECEPQMSVLDPVPQTVDLDATVEGQCGLDGSVTINSDVEISLPETTLACTEGATGPVAICATGTTPLTLATTFPPDPPVDSGYVAVEMFAGQIRVAFQCGGPATTNPPPGEDVECTLPNLADGPCDDVVGAGSFGEMPFPVSDCDFSEGFPGTCQTVPVALNPVDECVTFEFDAGAGGSGGAGR